MAAIDAEIARVPAAKSVKVRREFAEGSRSALVWVVRWRGRVAAVEQTPRSKYLFSLRWLGNRHRRGTGRACFCAAISSRLFLNQFCVPAGGFR
jgi:hypothetical protein